jgi:hypothetical protein
VRTRDDYATESDCEHKYSAPLPSRHVDRWDNPQVNDSGFIYVRNWKKRQHHKYESPPWHKVYNNLLHDDDYLSLSAADRGVLHALWMLASVSGDGRVSANSKSLARRLNVRRVSLEPLIQAGFIEVFDTKRVREESESVTTEQSREEKRTTEQPSSEMQPGTPTSTNGTGTAIETINGEDPDLARWTASLSIRTDPIGRLVATIGSSCDRNTETTIQKIGATEAEIHRARESLERAEPRPANPAGFVVNALKSMVAERGAHLTPVPTRKETA